MKSKTLEIFCDFAFLIFLHFSLFFIILFIFFIFPFSLFCLFPFLKQFFLFSLFQHFSFFMFPHVFFCLFSFFYPIVSFLLFFFFTFCGDSYTIFLSSHSAQCAPISTPLFRCTFHLCTCDHSPNVFTLAHDALEKSHLSRAHTHKHESVCHGSGTRYPIASGANS